MKFLFILLFLVQSYLWAQSFPTIPSLQSKDFLFSQYQQEVQQSNKDFAKTNVAYPTFYSYKATKDDSIFTIAARCNIWHETLSTINCISDSKESIAGKTLILPSCNGIFIPEYPNSAVEILLANEHKEKLSQDNVPRYKINNRTFYFLVGQRFSSAERAYFLNPGLSMPLEKSVLTSSFGNRKSPITGKWQFHKGIDLAAPKGTSVFACKSGTIKYIERNNYIYGNYIIISHAGGIESLYAHLSEILVEEDQLVSTSQQIGKVGDTGLATGPHLHFEIKQNGESLNPNKYLK